MRGDGCEIPFAPQQSTECIGTWELLLQNARGRYLQLKLELRGNGRNTPRIWALRVYYPRFSYLEKYLPAIYRENPPATIEEVDNPAPVNRQQNDEPPSLFLERFLANIEGMMTTLEEKITHIQVLFDPRTAPKESLDWLADWFGMALDPSWGEAKQRLFIKHAMNFFQFRGTICGIENALRLAFAECAEDEIFASCLERKRRSGSIRIVERFRTRTTPAVVCPMEAGKRK
jgi:phage tail-like protein